MDAKTLECEELRWARLEISCSDLRNIPRGVAVIVNGNYSQIIISIEDEERDLILDYLGSMTPSSSSSLTPEQENIASKLKGMYSANQVKILPAS